MSPGNLSFEGVFDPDVYLEMADLMDTLTWRQRRICLLRFGFGDEVPHTLEEVAGEFNVTRERIRQIVESSVRRLHVVKRDSSLVALERVLGPDKAQWPARAWMQTAHRGRYIHRRAEAQLLLAIGGMNWRAARRSIEKYLRDQAIEIGRTREAQRSEMRRTVMASRASAAVDRLVAHTLWPSTTKPVQDLRGFSLQRGLPQHARVTAGYFDSKKLKRAVQYESSLELDVFETFELASQVVSYQEQPLRVDVKVDAVIFNYTPDVVVQLDDGRAIVVELKPPHKLGLFDGWLRWAALARWCGKADLGLLVGSPRYTVVDLLRSGCDPRLRTEVLRALDAGPLSWGDYRLLAIACNAQMTELASVAIYETLDWRLVPFRLRVPDHAQRQQAAAWWRLVACYSQARDIPTARSPAAELSVR